MTIMIIIILPLSFCGLFYLVVCVIVKTVGVVVDGFIFTEYVETESSWCTIVVHHDAVEYT